MKIYRAYRPLFDFSGKRFSSKRYYKEDREGEYALKSQYNPKPHKKMWQLLGALQPVADMGKDITNLFKPYKSRYHIFKDLFQFIHGIINIFQGIGNLIMAPLIFIYELGKDLFRNIPSHCHFQNFLLNATNTTSWLLEGALNIARGVTQILAAPLTWLLKMPIRGIITAVNGGFPKIEDHPKIQRLVTEGDLAKINSPIQDLLIICEELHREFINRNSCGQNTTIKQPTITEANQFKEIYNVYNPNMNVTPQDTRAAAGAYFQFFNTARAFSSLGHRLGDSVPRIR